MHIIINEVTWPYFMVTKFPHPSGWYSVGRTSLSPIVLLELGMRIVMRIAWNMKSYFRLLLWNGSYVWTEILQVDSMSYRDSDLFSWCRSDWNCLNKWHSKISIINYDSVTWHIKFSILIWSVDVNRSTIAWINDIQKFQLLIMTQSRDISHFRELYPHNNEVIWPTFVALNQPYPVGHYAVSTRSACPLVL